MKTITPLIVAVLVLLGAGFLIMNSDSEEDNAVDQSTDSDSASQLIAINAGDIYRYDADGKIVGFKSSGGPRDNKLTRTDLSALATIDNVESATAFSVIPGEVKTGDSLIERTILAGVGSDFLSVLGFQIDQGRFFSEDEVDRNVAFVGNDVAELLGGEVSGQTLKINSRDFEILGSLNKIIISSTSGVDFNRLVLIPLEKAEEFWGEEFGIQEINIYAKDIESVPQIVEDARTHLLKTRTEDEFTIISSTR
ncbi:MAG: ABC transporter permease [Candidatus Saccharimonadales bacterium]|nr:ABC transporter permease [Candidatus Saccharimonadales bacterium]